MREIKFRAWDTVQEKMLPVEVIDFRQRYISLNEGDNSVTDTFEMFELMQYTGLKDKNGKEIFEGDIVKTSSNSYRKTNDEPNWSKFCEFEEVVKENISVVEWWHSAVNNGYRLRNGKGKTLMLKSNAMLRTMNTEVVGNIYENPELLGV